MIHILKYLGFFLESEERYGERVGVEESGAVSQLIHRRDWLGTVEMELDCVLLCQRAQRVFECV